VEVKGRAGHFFKTPFLWVFAFLLLKQNVAALSPHTHREARSPGLTCQGEL
jgi:hypothetical protein